MPQQDLCTSLQQCQKRHVRWPGTWHLAPRRAISLMPHQPSQILIVQGHAWITWERRGGGAPRAEQDMFLGAGQTLDVPAGVRLVMESTEADRSIDFDWRVMPSGLIQSTQGAVPSRAELWRHWLVAWGQLAAASGALWSGLVRQAAGRTRPVASPGSVA